MDRSIPWRLIAGFVSLAVLVVITVASVAGVAAPHPRGADTPVDEFSAGRAFEHVTTVSQQVHVAGGEAAAEVRGYIIDTLTGLGLTPEVHEGIGQTTALGGPAMAHVQNVVATIPGTSSTGRLILVAHYDSVQVSYGANDDGAGVASLLETARALTNGPALRNDVILLFTDAEEACLCGAEAFVHSDPLAADGGVVINLESRGSSGPAIMFETATGNADLIRHYAAAVPYPVSTSMAVEVYRILPNDTDFTPFLDSGRFTGMNSAYIDGSATYHTPEDRADYMDQGSLQSLGANALALARELGDADLAALSVPGDGDATYFPVFSGIVHYPGWLTWPLAVLAVAGAVGLALLVRRRIGVGWGRLAAGVGLGVVPLIGAALLAQLFWTVLVWLRPGYGAMLDPWHPGWYRGAVVALVALLLTAWYGVLRRRMGPEVLTVAAVGWLALLGVALSAVTPGGAYLPVLPAMAVATAGIVVQMLPRAPWWVAPVAHMVAGAIAVVVLAPTIALFFPALGLSTGAAAALIAAMLGLALVPVLEFVYPALATSLGRARRRMLGAAPALVCAGAVLALTILGLSVDGFDERHPRPTQLMYAEDATTGTAYWLSEQDDPGPWTSQYVSATHDLTAEFPLLPGALTTGPAASAGLPAPTLNLVGEESTADGRTLTVRVQPQREVRLVDLSTTADVVHATVEGREMDLSADRSDRFHLLFHAPPADGITVTVTVQGTGPVTFRVMDGSDGLADLPGFHPRPPDVGVQGSHTSELVLVADTVTIP